MQGVVLFLVHVVITLGLLNVMHIQSKWYGDVQLNIPQAVVAARWGRQGSHGHAWHRVVCVVDIKDSVVCLSRPSTNTHYIVETALIIAGLWDHVMPSYFVPHGDDQELNLVQHLWVACCSTTVTRWFVLQIMLLVDLCSCLAVSWWWYGCWSIAYLRWRIWRIASVVQSIYRLHHILQCFSGEWDWLGWGIQLC